MYKFLIFVPGLHLGHRPRSSFKTDTRDKHKKHSRRWKHNYSWKRLSFHLNWIEERKIEPIIGKIILPVFERPVVINTNEETPSKRIFHINDFNTSNSNLFSLSRSHPFNWILYVCAPEQVNIYKMPLSQRLCKSSISQKWRFFQFFLSLNRCSFTKWAFDELNNSLLLMIPIKIVFFVISVKSGNRLENKYIIEWPVATWLIWSSANRKIMYICISF